VHVPARSIGCRRAWFVRPPCRDAGDYARAPGHGSKGTVGENHSALARSCRGCSARPDAHVGHAGDSVVRLDGDDRRTRPRTEDIMGMTISRWSIGVALGCAAFAAIILPFPAVQS